MNDTDATGEGNGREVRNWRWACRLAVVLLLMFSFVVGMFAAGLGLRDPDTCWLIALGRWIAEHGSLPQTDPFSYTYVLFHPGQAPILYQWLSELCFHFVHQYFGLSGLVVGLAAVLAVALVWLPLAQLRRSGVPDLLSFILVLLAVAASSFHFLVRPEIFSYLFLSLWINLIALLDRRFGRELLILALAALVMILWCNFHSGFAVGLTVLVVYAVAFVLDSFTAADKNGWKTSILIKLVGCSVLATAFNPWGFRLWLYLPELFFMPFNGRIVELRPLTLADLFEFTYYPYFALLAAALILLGRRWRQAGLRSTGWFSVLTVLGWGVAALCCRRLIPFSALLLLAAVGTIYRSSQDTNRFANTTGLAEFTAESGESAGLNDALFKYHQPGRPMFGLTVMLFAMLGALLVVSNVVKLELPQSSKAFRPPIEAIAFLERTGQKGHIFNDAQFGDVMIWQMRKPLPVFIDTRYDMYGPGLIADYLSLINCGQGWRDLLDRYAVDLVLLRPADRLVAELNRLGGWRELYRDDRSVVVRRISGRGGY